MKYWCDNSAVLSHYYNGLSILFPAWEELWCKVMEAHKDKIKDPELLLDMDKFIKQEQSHANAHHAYNKKINELELEEYQKHKAEVLSKRPLSSTLLGAMVSIEYIAACLGKDFLDRYADREQKEFKLFAWHSKEEIDHKDVAFRVWSALSKDKSKLKGISIVNFKVVIGFVIRYTWNKCKEEKLLWKPSTWFDLGRMFIRIFTSGVLPYREILKPSFNPTEIKRLEWNY